jgi:outer membrane protein assembly factor BamB
LTSTTDEGRACHVICVDRRSGEIRWNRLVFHQETLRKEAKNSYATPTPVTDGQRVYAVFGSGSAVAVSFEGEVLWTNHDVQFYSRHGLGASPIVHDGLLIMPYDGSLQVAGENRDQERIGWQLPWDQSFVVALDAATGQRVWKASRGMSRIAHVTPVVLEPNGAGAEEDTALILSPAGDVIQAFKAKTGERVWTIFSRGEGVTPAPALGDGLIFTASGFEATTLRAVRSGGRGDVTATHIAWEVERGAPRQSSLLFVQPHLYAITDQGIVTCYQGDTGDIVYQQRVGGNFSASPVYVDGKIYFLSEDGETVVVRAGEEFELLARNPLGVYCQASMAVSQGNLFIRSQDHLYCIGSLP